MITSPSRNDSAADSVRKHDVEVPEKARKVSPASTATVRSRKKDLQNAIFSSEYKRAVLSRAVGKQCLVPTTRKSCKTVHYGRCWRCGRYFAALIKYLLRHIVNLLHKPSCTLLA